MGITIHDLFSDPNLFLFAFEREQAIFVRMDREAYYRSVFLDARIEPAAEQRIAVPAEAVAEWCADQAFATPPVNWIFHVANCGSTLLARALDRLRDDLVLREPLALRQLGVDRAGLPPSSEHAWALRLRLMTVQLGKRYRPDRPVIVKANVPVNFMLDDLMAHDPSAPAIFLYYPLRQYVLAIARSEDHRNWVMRVTTELGSALTPFAGDVARLDAIERAAALWFAQIHHFDRALSRNPRARSLDAATLFADPRTAIAGAASLFGVPLEPVQIDAIVASALFSTYSKNPTVAFDESARRERAASLERTMAADLARAASWVDARVGRTPLPVQLDRALTGTAPALL